MQLSAILAAGTAATLFSGGAVAHPRVSQRSVDGQALPPPPIDCQVVIRYKSNNEMYPNQARLVPAGRSTKFKFKGYSYVVATMAACNVVDSTGGGKLPDEYYFHGSPFKPPTEVPPTEVPATRAPTSK
ncbi:hypothetical protein PspLS_00087 [Pyricularia sp. CBS 133598]|nr:hypothetical protein PspLS_00087 [Pyricularia sp. CBS 133598]